MSSDRYIKSPVLTGFQGENRHIPSLQLPPTVSPDALNNDYFRGTIRKRNGLKRLDDRPVHLGGAFIKNAATNTAYGGDFAFNPSGSWALSFAVQITATAGGGATPRVILCGTETTDGFAIKFVPATGYVTATIESSGGTKTLSVAGAPVSSKIVNMMLIYFEGDSTNTYALYVDTQTDSDTSADTYVAPADTTTRWNYHGSAQTLSCFIDEVRWWDLSTLDDAGYATWLTHWTTDQAYKRELTAVEQALATLKGYWTFNGTDPQTPDVSPGGGKTFELEGGTDSSTHEARWARGLVNTHYDPTIPRVTSLIFHEDRFYRFFNTEISSVYNHTSYNGQYNTLVGTGDTTFPTLISRKPWVSCRFRNRMIGVHPDLGCFYTQGATAMKKLTPTKPDASAVTAASLGSGTGPGSGVYVFKFFYYDSTNDVISPAADDTLSVDTSAFGTPTHAIQMDNLTAILTSRPAIEGVDKLRIFRTKDPGTTFYYVDDITLSASPTDEYSGAGINKADSTLAEADAEEVYRYDLVGAVTTARACMKHRGYLVLLNTPDGAVDAPNDIAWSEPEATNLFYFENRIECLPDDGDFLVGGISVNGGALLAKRFSLAGLFGETPSTWQPRPISEDEGFLNHNVIAASKRAVYGLSDWGIIAVPLPLGSAPPVNVSQDAFKPFFDDIDPDTVNTACGVWWPGKSQYWCSFDTQSYGRVTLIFNERTGGIQYSDLEIEAFYVDSPDSGAPRLLASWRGYLVELDYGTNDGGTKVVSDADSTPTLTGTVTAGGDHTLTDSAQSWPTTSQNVGSANYADACSGLAGLWVTKVDQSSPAVLESRRIFYNSTTRLWVQTAWDTNPVAGDTFYIAGIPWHWKSPAIFPQGDPSEDARQHRLTAFFNKADSGESVSVDTWHDGTMEVDVATMSTDERRQEVLLQGRAREYEFRFENLNPDEPVEIEGLLLSFMEAAVRP